jgi:hypothetical protein
MHGRDGAPKRDHPHCREQGRHAERRRQRIEDVGSEKEERQPDQACTADAGHEPDVAHVCTPLGDSGNELVDAGQTTTFDAPEMHALAHAPPP